MSLPDTVRVKLSSEAAGSISITPVVVRDIPIRELIEHMLGVSGKNPRRIQELLLRGTLVSGASRFRWTGWQAEEESIIQMLAAFPDPDPARAFDPAKCVRVVLRGGRAAIDLTRQFCSSKPLWRRQSFWDAAIDVFAAAPLRYLDYSYSERADRYHAELSPAAAERIRAASGQVPYSTLRDSLRATAFNSAELFVER